MVRCLVHEHIIRYHAALVDVRLKLACLSKEHCDMKILDALVEHYSRCGLHVPEASVRHVHSQLVDALAYAHAGVRAVRHHMTGNAHVPGWQTILYRDLKPGNVFLTSPRHLIAAEAGSNASATRLDTYPRVVLGDFVLSIRVTTSSMALPITAAPV